MEMSQISSLDDIMKAFTLFPLALASLLAACGGTEPQDGTTFQNAALGYTVVVPAGPAAAAAQAPTRGAAPVLDANYPQPDCAPEGCSRPRIIDGNAEAYRLDAMRRSADEPDLLPQA